MLSPLSPGVRLGLLLRAAGARVSSPGCWAAGPGSSCQGALAPLAGQVSGCAHWGSQTVRHECLRLVCEQSGVAAAQAQVRGWGAHGPSGGAGSPVRAPPSEDTAGVGLRPQQDWGASDHIPEGGACWGFQQEGSLQEREGADGPRSRAAFSSCCVLSAIFSGQLGVGNSAFVDILILQVGKLDI